MKTLRALTTYQTECTAPRVTKLCEISHVKGLLVEFPLASFLSVPDENGSGSLHENFFVRFRVGPTFVDGPVLVPLAVLYGTVPSVLVQTRGLSVWFWYGSTWNRSRANGA